MDEIIKLPEIKNYEKKRKEVLSLVSKYRKFVPSGYLNDEFMECLIRVLDYFEEKYGKSGAFSAFIPDKNKFLQIKPHYSMRDLVLNRAIKNIKYVNFVNRVFPLNEEFDSPSEVNAEYIHKTSTIRIYNSANDPDKEYNFAKKHSLVSNKAVFMDALRKASIIHEILHAVSDNGRTIGFSDILETDEMDALDEGFTECLANEIAGTDEIYRQTVAFDEFNNGFGTRGQIFTGYLLETGIVSMLRFASDIDLVDAYLTNGDAREFALGKDKEFKPPYARGYNGLTPIESIKKFLSTIEYENPSQKDLAGIQWLQSVLLEEALAEKINKDYILAVIKGGIKDTYYNKLKQDVNKIGRHLVLKYAPLENLSDQECDQILDEKYGVPFGITDTTGRLETLIVEGIVEDTPNVRAYRELLRRVEYLEKYVDYSNDNEKGR